MVPTVQYGVNVSGQGLSYLGIIWEPHFYGHKYLAIYYFSLLFDPKSFDFPVMQIFITDKKIRLLCDNLIFKESDYVMTSIISLSQKHPKMLQHFVINLMSHRVL